MTETERAIIHDLETLETDYHMLEAELAAVRKALEAAEARAEKCRGMAVRHASDGCEECRMLLEEVTHG